MLARLVTLCIIGNVSVALLLGACGGQSSSVRGNDAGSGATPSNAGTNAGGTGGAASNEACSGAATGGGPVCDAAIPSYTHDSARGLCRPFEYDGCSSSLNRYDTLADCQAACADTTPRSDTCKTASDCVLGGATCCGPCDNPGLTVHDFIAYNQEYASRARLCGDVACGPCPEPDGEPTVKYFAATCVNERCVVEDLRKNPVTACTQDTECTLRRGSHCCTSCGGGGLHDVIAVRNDGSFEELLCSDDVGCPECASLPIEASAACSSGRCVIAEP